LKIYSKFQDYYDSALGSFMESDVEFNRTTSTVKVKSNDVENLGNFDGRWNIHKDRTYSHSIIHMVGFCGKWYFLAQKSNEDPTLCYVTFEEIKDNAEHNGFWFSKKNLINPNDSKYWNTEIFEKYGPILYIEELKLNTRWKTNNGFSMTIFPNLKDLNFQTQKDPYSALWELEHWYDTHARPDDAVVPVGDDLTRIKAAGFDTKTSFRKMKRD